MTTDYGTTDCGTTDCGTTDYGTAGQQTTDYGPRTTDKGTSFLSEDVAKGGIPLSIGLVADAVAFT
jgi:hypothetical protein